MNPDSYVGEKLVWFLGTLLLALLGLFFGNLFGSHDKVDKAVCEERRASCMLHTNSMLGILQKNVQDLSDKIDKLIEKG